MRNKTQELLEKVLKYNNITKYRIAKELNISWITVHNWQKGFFEATENNYKNLLGYYNSQIGKEE